MDNHESADVSWKTIRLELARTPQFPEGSASRAYLVHLPLDEDCVIDEQARAKNPAHARVRRFWPNEPDLSGYVIRTPKGWAFSYAQGEDDDEAVFHLENHAMRQGEYITLTEPDGSTLPFRITSIHDMA